MPDIFHIFSSCKEKIHLPTDLLSSQAGGKTSFSASQASISSRSEDWVHLASVGTGRSIKKVEADLGVWMVGLYHDSALGCLAQVWGRASRSEALALSTLQLLSFSYKQVAFSRDFTRMIPRCSHHQSNRTNAQAMQKTSQKLWRTLWSQQGGGSGCHFYAAVFVKCSRVA